MFETWRGPAWQGSVGLGRARRGWARPGPAWQGAAGRGKGFNGTVSAASAASLWSPFPAGHATAVLAPARLGWARQGSASQGKGAKGTVDSREMRTGTARRARAWHGPAGQGKARAPMGRIEETRWLK